MTTKGDRLAVNQEPVTLHGNKLSLFSIVSQIVLNDYYGIVFQGY